MFNVRDLPPEGGTTNFSTGVLAMPEDQPKQLNRRNVGENIWLSHTTDERACQDLLAGFETHELRPEVLESEQAVGEAMLAAIEAIARNKDGDIVMILLGGRGA